MVAYYILVGGSFAVYLIYFQFRKRENFLVERKNYEVVFFFSFFILMLALRHSTVGSDTERYIYLFREIRYESLMSLFNESTEIGYRFVEKLLTYFFSNPQLYLAINAVITIVPIAFLYYKEAELPMFSLMLFLALPTFNMAFTGMRQMVAIALFIPAYYMVKEKKIIKFLVLVAVAFLFHQSAFIILLLYPIYHLSIKIASLAVVLPTIAFVLLYNAVIYQWIIRFLPAKFIERYSDITETGGYSVLLLLIALVALSFFLVRQRNLDKETAGLKNVLIMAAVLQCFAPISTIATRVNYYFFVLVPIAVARIINRSDEDKRPFAVIACIALTVFVVINFFYRGYHGEDGFMIFPYKTCFEWLNT